MDDNVRDGWAAASVRIRASDVTSVGLPPALLAKGELSSTHKVVSFDVGMPPDGSLADLLVAARNFLEEHASTLQRLTGSTIDLFLGWSPKSPQESLLVDDDLIRLLARLDASIVFDTYSE